MTPRLRTEGLAKQYGEVAALLPTDLEVRAGEFLTLLGPSGSGKTTLLMLLAGLVPPSAGRLFLDGRDATAAAPGERDMGMVFQNYALFPHMTVWDNVAYGLRARHRRREEIARVVDAALGMVHMRDLARRHPRELSGGQQQRIALARCFAYRPGIILLDEPLGALDRKLREHLQAEMRRLHAESGATFIYVTHDQDEALAMSDRICLMNQARIEQLGTPAELYDHPASVFAAGFLGQSNLLAGTLAGPGRFRWQGGELPAPHCATSPGEAATLLVRPEAARLTPSGEGLLEGTVTDLVFLGSDVRAVLALPGGLSFAVRCPRSAAPRRDERVGTVWEPDAATVLTR